MIKQRIKVITIGLLLAFPGIVLRLFYLQVVHHPAYAQEATRNLEQYQAITPNRGAIRDCQYRLMVKTAPDYHISVQPGKVTDSALKELGKLLSLPIEEIIEKVEACQAECDRKILADLARELKIPPSEDMKELGGKSPEAMAGYLEKSKYASARHIMKTYRRLKQDYYRRKYPLFKHVSHKTAMELALRKYAWNTEDYHAASVEDRFSGLEIEHTVARQYPLGNTMVHILGRVGPVSRDEYLAQEKDFRMQDIAGREGLEKTYEEKLRGSRGCSVNSRQGYDFTEYPRDGMDLVLTIDAEAQKVAEESLDLMLAETPTATGGAAVVLDATSGEIVVLATSPRYENDAYPKKYQEWLADPKRPLENRAIENSYPPPPGSVFKIMVALYALHHNYTDEHRGITCRGFLKERGSFACTHVHGTVDLVDAIAGSCNIYFYTMGEEIGPQGLAECARIFGFGEKCGVEIDGEQTGLVPTPDWKKRALREEWYPGDSRMFGIGQRIEVTPLQVARAMAMVATRGTLPRAHLVKAVYPPDYDYPAESSSDNEISLVAYHPPVHTWSIEEKYWDLVHEGMRLVTEGDSHLATGAKLRNKLKVRIASKTGTAEVGKDQVPIFNVSLVHRQDLESEILSAELREEFAQNHNGLSTRATVKKTDEDKWQIDDRFRQYFLITREQAIEIRTKAEDHAWFAGFFPVEGPRYSFAVFIEHGGYGGQSAGPVAVDIINYLYR